MSVRVELFSTGSAGPDALWSVVGDPSRLPEWTDADEVVATDVPLAPGSAITVTVDRAQQHWEVVTAEQRLLEARTHTPRGGLALGVRVVPDPRGARLVLAGRLQPEGLGSTLRARVVDAPALRRRFDRWAQAALRAAGED